MNINLTLFAQALAFAGLIWIIATKIWPPLLAAIEERQQKIAEGLAAADRSQKDLAQAQEKVNEALKEARVKANEIIDQAHARANQIVDAAKNDAIAEANRQKALAVAEIDAAALADITASLRKRFDRQVEVTTAVDPALIGGAVIDAGDVVIDGSLKGKLGRLQSALAN